VGDSGCVFGVLDREVAGRVNDGEGKATPENLDDAKGRVKEAAGDLTDDKDLKNEGKVDRATGTVKDKVGDVSDKVKETIRRDDDDD
jgi:uncharacterized protein YjbJ (UPF0337 family)